jgi:hypothetical protein
MEINELQNIFVDNQPLAQSMLEINDLRASDGVFTSFLPRGGGWRAGERRLHLSN